MGMLFKKKLLLVFAADNWSRQQPDIGRAFGTAIEFYLRVRSPLLCSFINLLSPRRV
jgi:hypothetical protein